MYKDSRLSRIGETNADHAARRESNTRLAVERKFVRKILKSGGVTPLDLKVSEHKWEGPVNEDYYLSLAWFFDEYPMFPMRLAANEIWRPSLADFFRPRRSKTNTIWSKWADVVEAFATEIDRGTVVGVMFPLPQAVGLGDMIMHNGGLYEDNHLEKQQDIPYMARRLPDGNTIILEKLDLLLERIRCMWAE